MDRIKHYRTFAPPINAHAHICAPGNGAVYACENLMPELTCREAALSEDYYDYILTYSYLQQLTFRPQDCIQPIDPDAGCVYVSSTGTDGLLDIHRLYSYIPGLYGLMEPVAESQIQTIDLQQENILDLDGNGVLIGIVGTGINYESPYFRSRNGSTRIKEIWDQTDQSGTTPPDIAYGTVYSEDEINAALDSDNPSSIVPVSDSTGYGTYLASAAAATENESATLRGVAPRASLAVVKLKPAKRYLRELYAVKPDANAYQENDIMLAIKYLRDLANRLSMPLCICLGIGTSTGNHDGSSFLSRYIDSVSIGQRCIICGTGDEAAQRHHFQGNFVENVPYVDVEVRVENNPTGFWMELWGIVPDIYSISVISPSGEVVPRIPYQSGISTDYRFAFEGSELTVSYPITGEYVGNSFIIVRMRRPSNGIWTFRIYNYEPLYGQFHMWLPISEFLDGDTYFLASNPDITLTEPSCSGRCVTVGAYNIENNSIFIDSGRGFTLTNRIKPYVAAPGVGIPGITTSDILTYRSGTAVSSALTCGVCALIFQWTSVLGNSPNFSSSQMITLLILGAGRTPGRTYPSREWGYGTLDLLRTFENFRPI